MRKISDSTKNSILRMWTQGVGKTRIAEATRVTWPTVHRVVKEWEAGPGKGFKRRPLIPEPDPPHEGDDDIDTKGTSP